MRAILRCAFAAIVVALCAQQAAAQPVTGCPPGQAMQSSDPSGKKITCIPVPDVGTINAAISAEAAARASGDAALGARIDGLSEADIVGNWATTGTTTCLQSSQGFNPNSFSPNVPTVGFTVVSLLSGDFIGTNTFYAGGTGHTVGASLVVTTAGTSLPPQAGFISTGGASVAAQDSTFNWSIQSDGTLLYDHPDPIVQPFTAPPSLLGQTATIDKVPTFIGYISKDKRTIVLSHSTMTLETSTRSATPPIITPRYCSRTRVMTRLP